MPVRHLKILTHFNHACDELKNAENVLVETLDTIPETDHFLIQFSKDIEIEINRIEYLIRKEIERRERELQNKRER